MNIITLRKIFYILGMALLSGLLIFGLFALGTICRTIGFDAATIGSIVSTAILILYGVCFFRSVFLKKSPKPQHLPLGSQLRLSLFGQVLVFVLLLASAFLIGASNDNPPTVFLAFILYHVYCYLSTVFMTFDALTEGEEIDESAYPALFDVAKRAMQAVGLPNNLRIRLFFRANFAVSAIKFDDEMRLLLGTHLPAILNDYELEAAITSELGLLLDGSPNVDVSLRRRVSHWQAAIKNDVMCFPNFFVAHAAMAITWNAERHFLSCVAEDENCRLRAAKNYGIHSDSVNAYAKMIAYDLFLYAPSRRNPYEGDLPPGDFQESLIQEYRSFIASPMPRFRDAVLHHTPHDEAIPLARRMEFLSIEDFSVIRTLWNDAYEAESERILKIGNEDFATEFEENYEARRQQHFLIPKAVTEQYEARLAAGITPTDPETLEAVSAFRAIGEPDRGEALLDTLLERDPHHALASEGKGQFLLERYDPQGIRYLEIAMQQNRFSEERNIKQIRHFYQKIGDGEKAQAVSLRVDEVYQREHHRQRSFESLSRADDFCTPPLSPDVLHEVIEEIRHQIGDHLHTAYIVGCREESLSDITYLVIKTQTPPSSPSVITAMKRLFLYLDNRVELFCLIYLEDKPIIDILSPAIEGIVIVKPEK